MPYWVDFGNDYNNVQQRDFTIINSNNDKYAWEFIPPHMSMGQQLSGAVACGNYSSVNGADDWFITPGIALKAGRSYHFKSNGHGPSEGTSWYEHMEVKAGTSKSVESMTIPVINAKPVINYMAIEGDFTVPEDGNYYFGLHSVSAPSQWEIAIFDISITETWNYYLNRGSVVCGTQPLEDQFGYDVGKSWNAYSAFNGDIILHFSKVDISTLATPKFECDLILEDTNTDMQIIFNGPDGKQVAKPMTVMDGIQHISLPLNEFQSWGWVQPVFKITYHLEVEGDSYHDVFFDNVGIFDAQPVNLAMIGFEVPAQLSSGEEAMANVTIMNMGQQPVKDYTVTLAEDDVVMQSETVAETLNPGGISVVQFRYRANTVNAFDATGMEDAEKMLVATLECEGDAVESDNAVEAVVTINVSGGKQNSYPTDAMARLANDGQGVDVSWNFDIEQPRKVVTESFEDYELWYNGGVKAGAPEGQLGIWRLYDGENKPTYSFNGLDIITSYAGEPQAFQVFNGNLFSGMSEYYYYDFTPASGEQYLVSMDPADGNYAPQPDDYIISPMVPGGTNVEFYYGSLVRKPQGIEVLYSETGRDISDFKLLKRLDDASGSDWYFAYFTLPETAKYFAIHHDKSAYLGYGLKIDDITYIKVDAISGFNIYVDGKLVGTSKENAFTIKEGLASGSHKIAVTAVFADGTESVPAYVTYDTELAIREILSSDKPFDIYGIDGKLVRQQTRSIQGLKGVFVINNKTVVLK